MKNLINKLQEKLYVRKVCKTLKVYNNSRKISELHDLIIMRTIEEEEIQKICMMVNHSISRLITLIGLKGKEHNINMVILKEIEVCQKKLDELKKLYLATE